MKTLQKEGKPCANDMESTYCMWPKECPLNTEVNVINTVLTTTNSPLKLFLANYV